MTKEEIWIIKQFIKMAKPEPGLFPTSYVTLSYEGDLKLYNQVKEIERKLDET